MVWPGKAWRGKGRKGNMTRTERRKLTARTVATIMKVERRYTDKLKKIVKPAILKAIDRAKTAMPHAVKEDGDAWDKALARAAKDHKGLLQRLARHDGGAADDDTDMDEAIGEAYDEMLWNLAAVNAKNLEAQGIAVDLRKDPKLFARMVKARQENVALINKHKAAYFDDVEEIMGNPENYGLGVKGLVAQLMERGNVWLSRAEMIARDQTCKSNAAITRFRHEEAGISEYQWSCSLDERVRPMHRALEGKRFSYDDPPETNDDGDRNNPGEDFSCRCVGIPQLDELQATDEDTDEGDGNE